MTSSSSISHLHSPGASMDRPVEKPKARRRNLWIGGGVAAALVVTGLALWLVPSAGSVTVKKSETETAEVARAPFQDYLPLRAEVAPLTTVYVTAVEGGQVEQVLVQDGAEVAAGAPLARLANPQLQLDVTAREADIAARLGDVSAQELALQRARAEREQEVADTAYKLMTARRELEKRQRLHDAGFESDAGVRTYADEAQYHRDHLAALKTQQVEEQRIARAQQGQIRQMANRLQSNLQIVQDSLGALVVRAPAAGRLTNFDLHPGQPLKAGETLGQVDSEGAYKLVADIDEFYLGRIAPGQAATIDLDGRKLALKVLRVLPQVTAGRFKAEFAFQGAPPASLRRGQTLDLRLTLGDTRPALVLPNGAWLEASGGNFAFVVHGGRAQRRAIAVGRRNPEQVEILKGLKPGDRVVVSSYAGLEPYKQLILR
ncbi:efflux RND transporter periplasmic adaptor subunit [Phenylobacterium sp.]|uniref:efflux RND transporter periplasmic adaptor subunit n=1 Tax=Phenylobacterium sp. TaxID=1871053 RepID=UPI0025D66A03|nr:efflux RND transporter periplasmic adaptor subunit [Phenylobacterium sp.]